MDTVVFLNPITGRPSAMPTEMVSAYVPFASHLRLEEAAKVAAIRDDEAAANLLLSVIEVQHPEVVNNFEKIIEGAGFDTLSVETPSLQ